jgi:ABC-type transport system involved in cytochrome c biogenesis permease subunit
MKELLLVAAGLYLVGGTKKPLFALAVVVQLVYLCQRGMMLGRLPIVGPHDTIAFFAMSIGLMGLPFVMAKPLRQSAFFSWGMAALAGLFSLLAFSFKPSMMPLPPVLKTLWFEFHVALAFFAYGLFAIGALLGGWYLVRRDRLILDLQYRAALVGYSFFSASMVTGGIWGYFAWGTYWLWTPKELWTAVLWLFYSFYLHFRLKGTQWDTVTAWGGIIGFAVSMFTYLGVSLLMKSSHSF